METIKKISINGATYSLSDCLVVTITDDAASHTSAEIYAHVQGGGTALLIDGEYIYALVGCTEDYASFNHSYDDSLLANILIYGSGIVERREYTNLGSDTLSNYIHRPSTAEIGQTIVVKSVDANGKPTEWEAADLPTPKDGEDGVSVTHSWDGTTLIVTSASGTSSADLKGEKGETGPTGPQGPQGEKGDKGDTGDPGLTWRGTWNEEMHSGSASGAGYTNGDVVYHNGSAYVFDNESNPESEPGVEDSVWSLLAAKGDTGEQGIQGEKGEKGDTGATGPAYTLTDTDKTTIASAVKASLTTESWTFTLDDGSTVTKAVYVG